MIKVLTALSVAWVSTNRVIVKTLSSFYSTPKKTIINELGFNIMRIGPLSS